MTSETPDRHPAPAYAYGEWVLRRRWWIIFACLLSFAAMAAGLKGVAFNKDLRIYFSEDNPEFLVFDAIEKIYLRNDNLMYVVAPRDGDVFTRATLSAIEALTNASWRVPFSRRVDSLTNFQHTRADGDNLFVADLVKGADGLDDSQIAEIREIALNEPFLVNALVSARGHVAGVNVFVLKNEAGAEVVGDVMRHARDTVDAFREAHPDIDIYLVGGIPTDATFGSAALNDFGTLWPIMYLVILVVLGLTIRTVFGTLLTLLVILLTAVAAVGMTGWFAVPLNPTTVKAPTLLLALSVAHSVHLLVTLYRELRGGRGKNEAIVEALRVNMQPIFITSATTSIGFLALNFSDAPPFRELGNIVAFGMIVAFVYSVTLVPALMAVLPIRARPRRGTGPHPIDRLADFIVARRRPLFWGTLAGIAVLSSGIARIELDDNFIRYFDHRYEFRRNADFVLENLTGLQSIEYSLSAGEDGGISDPVYLANLEAFAAWYRAQPTVAHVRSFSDTLKRLNKNMHGDDPAYYRVPESRDLAAQYLLLYEMSLPYGLDLNDQIDIGKSATRFIVILADETSRGLKRVDAKAQQWLSENAPAMRSPGSGLSVIYANLSERNLVAMLGGSVMALVLISLILIVAFRSVRIGLISLAPNLFPVAMAFGAWGFTVREVGLAIATVVAMTLGIVVDDTVHFLSKYLRARRERGDDPADAVRYAFSHVGVALLVTTVVLVLGFCVLGTSGYRPSSHVGWLSATTLVLALVADFFFLPPLLMMLDRRKR